MDGHLSPRTQSLCNLPSASVIAMDKQLWEREQFGSNSWGRGWVMVFRTSHFWCSLLVLLYTLFTRPPPPKKKKKKKKNISLHHYANPLTPVLPPQILLSKIWFYIEIKRLLKTYLACERRLSFSAVFTHDRETASAQERSFLSLLSCCHDYRFQFVERAQEMWHLSFRVCIFESFT